MGTKILNLLRGIFAPVALLLVLAAVVLLFGARWGIRRPWHFVLAGALVLAGLLAFWIWWMIARRRERRFEDTMVEQAQADAGRASVARRAEMEALVNRWKESVRLLREASVRGKGVLNSLPWFAIIGESQSGKTTLLKNSGLDFPIGDAKIRGIGGTKNCDWWFANEAIILDTAGRYAFEVQSAPDREEWERFLGLLRKSRGRNPINGLVVTVPCDSLLRKGPDELGAYAQHLRGKINDLMTRLGTVFPVYLIVTKVDLVEGFVSFFERYPAERVREAVGRTFADVRPARCLETASKTLDHLYDRLCSMSLGLMMEYADTGAPAQPLLMHPEEFRGLAEKLKTFMEALFRENIYMRNPIFRGLYLTSGTQEGRTIAAAFQDAAAGLRMNPEVLTTLHAPETPKRAYFVRDLLSRILVDDAKRDLVRPLAVGARQQFARAFRTVLLPAALVVCALLIWALAAWASNRAEWRGIAESMHPDGPAGRYLRPGAAADPAPAVQGLSRLWESYRRATSRSTILNLGLNRRDPGTGFREAFRTAVERNALEPLLAKVKSNLESGQAAPRDYVEMLAAYAAFRRALGDPEKVGPEELEALAHADSRLESWRADVGRTAKAYADLGGRLDGGVNWGSVARGIRSEVLTLSSTDAESRLRTLVQQAGPALVIGSEQSLSESWIELRALAQGGTGGVDVPQDLLVRLERDLAEISEARPARDALQSLRPLLGAAAPSRGDASGGKAEVFAQQVRAPLKLAADLETPACQVSVPADTAGLEGARAALQKLHDDLSAHADAFRQGIRALNAHLSASEQIDPRAAGDLVVRGRMAEAYRACAGAWFDSGGPLERSALAGAAAGGGPAPEPLGPAGQGLFRCDFLLPTGGGGGNPALAAKVAELGPALGQVWSVADLPSDLVAAQRRLWDGYRGAATGAGGGVSWAAALDAIEADTAPDTWSLEDIPAVLEADGGTLETILSKIKGGMQSAGQPLSRFQGFSEKSYSNALKAVGQAIQRAIGETDPTRRDLALGAVASGPDLANALQQADRAPSTRLRTVLKSVPLAIQKKLPVADVFALYRPRLEATLSRYPFRSGSREEVGADAFEEIFGSGGIADALRGATPSPGPRTKKFLDAARAVQERYKNGKLALSVTAPVPTAAVEKGADREKLPWTFETARFSLGGSVADRTTPRIEVALDPDAMSGIEEISFSMGEAGRGVVFRKDPYKVELVLPPKSAGTWSFLRFLETGSPERRGSNSHRFTWQVPALDREAKKEKDKRIGTVTVVLEVGSPLVDPAFWKAFELPRSTND